MKYIVIYTEDGTPKINEFSKTYGSLYDRVNSNCIDHCIYGNLLTIQTKYLIKE